MIPVFTITVALFVIIFTIANKNNTRKQEEVTRQFLEREQNANHTRKADISQLAYITIPLEKFPLNLHSKTEEQLRELAGKKILNLTGQTNTDLKLAYGAANLEALTEYDNNFTELVRALSAYAAELIDADQPDDAVNVLEFGVLVHADSANIYLTLADLYEKTGRQDSIPALISSASQLNSRSKDSICTKLRSYVKEESDYKSSKKTKNIRHKISANR